MMEFKLIGFIAGDTFGNKTQSHFVSENGEVLCGAKCKFGYDAHTEVKFVSLEEIYTDQFKIKPRHLWKWHLPFASLISCKKCQKLLKKQLS